ncbi:ABC transporter substrate-binding protein [Pillotina sp. SPG140]|jgi:raffinose/stachyose/melibiose transport system substrate-binding protein
MKRFLLLILYVCGACMLFSCKPKNEASVASAGTRKAELNIMMSFPQYMEQWEKYARQFEAKVLAEEKIELRINLEMPSSEQYTSVLQARLTGNTAPDLYTLHCNDIGTYTRAGHLSDLSGEALSSKIFENVKNTVTVDGKLMAVPIESQAWGVLYNKAIFADAGVTPPETLDELKAVCNMLISKSYTPFMLAFQEQWVPQLMTALTLGGKVTGDVPDWLTRMYNDAGSYTEMKDIFDVINLIMANGTRRAMEQGSEMGAAEFANGAAAMFVQGTWASNTIMQANPYMQLGVLPLPVNNNPKCTLVNLSTSTILGVYPDSKEKELALRFANYVLDDNDSSALFQACGFNPLAASHKYEVSSWIKDAYAYVEQGRSYQDLVIPSAVTNEQGKLLQELYVRAVTVDQIITQLDRAFRDANRLAQ